VKCFKERTLVMCSQGREVELFDLLAQLIVERLEDGTLRKADALRLLDRIERLEDGTLRKADALRLLDRIERLYFKVHEYVTSEEDWLF